MVPESHKISLQDFRFHTGDVLPQLHLHCTTWGNPKGQAVMLLHGTNGSAASLVTPEWQETLFGPGQALDLNHHWVIAPDALGCGRSSKPSQGLKARFPRYNYADMVQAQHRMLTEGLGVHHLKALIGYSMGGMHTWLWAQKHPGFMDAAVPMACMPTPISGRNWMMRRMVIDAIRNDPEWQQGEYQRPLASAHTALTYYAVATSGGPAARRNAVKAASTKTYSHDVERDTHAAVRCLPAPAASIRASTIGESPEVRYRVCLIART